MFYHRFVAIHNAIKKLYPYEPCGNLARHPKIEGYGWKYVCRTAKDTIITQDNEMLTFEQLQVCPGTRITLTDAYITQKQYGPVMAIAWWNEEYEEPIYLVSNLSIDEDPCDWYRMRFSIETLFSDQKSRGFHLHKSHLSDPERLAQLMIAACLAYIWIVYKKQARKLPHSCVPKRRVF